QVTKAQVGMTVSKTVNTVHDQESKSTENEISVSDIDTSSPNNTIQISIHEVTASSNSSDVDKISGEVSRSEDTIASKSFTGAFWESVKKPSLVKYLEFRLHEDDINNLETEHHSYIMELNTIAKHCAESPEIVQKFDFIYCSAPDCVALFRHQLPCQALFGSGKECSSVVGKSAVLLVAGDKSSEEVNLFWNLHQNIHTEIKLYEKKAHLHRKSKPNDLKDQISIKQTQHILDATKETLSQNLTLQRTVIKQHLLGKTDVLHIENSEPVTGQKRSYEEELPSKPPNKMKKLDLGLNVPKSFVTFPTIGINFNIICQFHWNLKDYQNALYVVCPLEIFEDGYVGFPELMLAVNVKQGRTKRYDLKVIAHRNLPIISE
ncbi:18342_t:CDS:2, partial [Acaulospora morrowiae]